MKILFAGVISIMCVNGAYAAGNGVCASYATRAAIGVDQLNVLGNQDPDDRSSAPDFGAVKEVKLLSVTNGSDLVTEEYEVVLGTSKRTARYLVQTHSKDIGFCAVEKLSRLR